MTSESEERHVGVPSQRPMAKGSAGAVRASEAVHAAAVASGTYQQSTSDIERLEREAGRPTQSPRGAKEPYDPVLHRADLPDDEGEGEGFGEQADGFWRGLLFQPIVVSITTLVVAGLLLVLVSEVFQFLQAINSAPPPLQWLGYSLVAALVLLAIWAVVRLVRGVTALRITPQLSQTDYCAARNRPLVRNAVRQRAGAGKEILRAIAADYPLADTRFRKLLTSCGSTDEAINQLRGDIHQLLSDDDLPLDSWLAAFDRRVLALIDELAKKRVRDYALRVGVKTALMPTSMADVLIVVTNSLLMLKDLCALYNVRTTPVGTCKLAGHLFMNAFVAARLEGQMNAFAQEATGAIQGAMNITPSAEDVAASAGAVSGAVGTALNNAVASAAIGAGRRVAEGTANYVLVRGLGSACILYLRPIQK